MTRLANRCHILVHDAQQFNRNPMQMLHGSIAALSIVQPQHSPIFGSTKFNTRRKTWPITMK